MYLNLKTDRPARLILYGMVVIGGVLVWSALQPVAAIGGEEPASQDAHLLEQRIYDLRMEQTVRNRRAEILRTQLDALESAMGESTDDAALNDLRAVRDDLLALLLDGKRAEDEIASSLHELWDAQGYAERASRREHHNEAVAFDWPVEPALGVSAHFNEASYKARFGFAHQAIDIPVSQGSIVRSIADGVVEKVSDKGMGFSSIVIRHKGGYASLYGHVSAFLVSEGDEVSVGDAIAKSGGTPGTPGAGLITTGPHLHLEVLKDGTHIDPLPLLPRNENVQ